MENVTSPQGAMPPQLDGAEVISALTALISAETTGRDKFLRRVEQLLHAGNWSDKSALIEHFEIPAQYFSGRLADALLLSGNIILLREGHEGFLLLTRMEQRWAMLDRDGQPLIGQSISESSYYEAIILHEAKPVEVRNSFSSLAALWPRVRGAWAEIGFASLFINAGQLLLPLFAMLIYDKIAPNGLFETLWALVAGIAIYLAADSGMRLVRSWSTERISLDLSRKGDDTLWSRLMQQIELPGGGFPSFLSNYRDLTLSRDFVSSSYLLALADLPFFLLYLVVIGIIAWPLMIVTILLSLIYATVGLVLQRRQSTLSREAERANTRKLAFMGEVLNCLDVMRTAPGAGSFLRHWRELAAESAGQETGRRLALQHAGVFAALMQTVTTVVILAVGVYLINAQALSTGKLIACNLLASRAMGLVASLFAITGKWQDFVRAATRMEESLEPVTERVFTPRTEITGQIAAIAVGKVYEGRPAALEKISFTIQPGERIALLGRPGAGKSTLLRCIAGLCTPESGRILIDGLALDDIARFDRIRWLAYKAQEPAIFAGTLEENLRISGCTDQIRFDEALWASGLESEFRGGRMSLGMQLTERGSNLSGGQRQKVALARAFAQNCRILLLDEPTLGLDPESERLLAERLPKLLDTTTTLIMTTHSSTMLKIAQRVIALDNGHLVADGPREKLVTLA